MPNYCAVYGCLQNSRVHKTRRFFRLPSEETRCRQWLKVINRIELQCKSVDTLHRDYCVCDLHFTDSEKAFRKLPINVVPTLQLPQTGNLSLNDKYTQCNNELPGPSTSKSTQTTKSLSANAPELKKLRSELKSESRKVALLETQITNLIALRKSNTNNMSPLAQNIMEMQKKMQHNYSGNRYDQEYLIFALSIYFSSPNAYKILSGILCLPTKRTLLRHLAFDESTKFDDKVVKCLEYKIKNLSEAEKCCIICTDEIPLKRHLYYQINKDKVVGFHEIDGHETKEIASQCVVVIARGVFSNWKHPLALCFLSESKEYEELNTWLDHIIEKMIEIGFNVLAFTSDHGSKVINMASNKSVTMARPYFFINNKKIHYIFDVPRILKTLRNNFIIYDFVYHDIDGSEHVASWNDIHKLYEIEKHKNYKMSSKLTKSHVKPNSLEKDNVKYAIQVLSRTVAVTISTLVENGNLPEQSIGTAKFIQLVNDTFDILNSLTVKDDNMYKKAFCEEDFQIDTLKTAKHVLSTLQVVDRHNGTIVTSANKCISSFLISIESVLSLASDLKNAGHKHLFTRRLNLDDLENLIAKKQQIENSRKPSVNLMYTAFKKVLITNVIHSSEKTSCFEELHQLLGNLMCETQTKPGQSVQIGTTEYRFEVPEANTFTYVCEYLLNKCYVRHADCQIMQKYVTGQGQIKMEENDKAVDTVIIPPENFNHYIRQIDSICENYLKNNDCRHISQNLLTAINEVIFITPCPCFPLEYLKRVYVRFRLFNFLKHNNKNFKNKAYRSKDCEIPILFEHTML